MALFTDDPNREASPGEEGAEEEQQRGDIDAGWGLREVALCTSIVIFIAGVVVMFYDAYAGGGTGVDVFWKPTVAIGGFGLASFLTLKVCRSVRWRVWTGVVGLAFLILDLAGCTISRGILVPIWGPLLAIATIGFVLRLVAGPSVNEAEPTPPGEAPLFTRGRHGSDREK